LRTTVGWDAQGFTDSHGHVFRGTMWYRMSVDLPADTAGRSNQRQSRVRGDRTTPVVSAVPARISAAPAPARAVIASPSTHQPQPAVDAYAKALALAPKHPHAADILTDQGVMYREMKAFDKAIANFKQAGKLDPNHLPSLLNIGVVYANDLHDQVAARKAWTRIIELAPGSPQAVQAKAYLEAK